MEEFRPTFAKLVDLYESGKLKCNLDFGQASPTGVFKGLDSIADAVEVKNAFVRVKKSCCFLNETDRFKRKKQSSFG